jgi:hypothetical protein
MGKPVNIYVKKKLQLGKLNFSQRQMLAVGNAGLNSIKARTKKALDAEDKPAKLKSKSWARIKARHGLRNVKDLRGTGQMYTDKIAAFRGRVAKTKRKLKNVGHLIDQILVRKVSENRAYIVEPSTAPGRMKARGNAEMLMLSPTDQRAIKDAAGRAFTKIKNGLVKVYVKKPNA